MADGPWVRSSGALLTRWITSSRAVDAGHRPFAGALSPGTEKCYRAGVATSSLHLTMECRDAPTERLEQVPHGPGPK
jgi:hypothetical protein